MISTELRQKRAEAGKRILEMRDLVNKKNGDGTTRGWEGDEEANWDLVNADYDELTRQIEIAERAERVEADAAVMIEVPGHGVVSADERAATGAAATRLRDQAFRGWLMTQNGDEMSEEQAQACQRLSFNPNVRKLDFDLNPTSTLEQWQHAFRTTRPENINLRAMSGATGGAGGTFISETMQNAFELNRLAFGSVAQVAHTIRTTSGETLVFPTADDTGNTGRQLGENAAVTTTANPSTNSLRLGAYEFTSDAALVPYSLLEDSQFDVAGMLGQMLGERTGRILNTKETTGTGAATIQGIVTASTVGATAAATAFTADKVLELIHSVDPAYRIGPGVGFMMNDAIVKAVRVLKSADTTYHWQPGMQDGIPDRIFGYPFTVNQDMASVMANLAISMLFGDLSMYKIRTVNQIRMYRLVERYRDNDQDGFVAFTREDGGLLNAGTQPVKHMAHAT